MPKEIRDIKQFIEIARRKDASAARIKKDHSPSCWRQDKNEVQDQMLALFVHIVAR